MHGASSPTLMSNWLDGSARSSTPGDRSGPRVFTPQRRRRRSWLQDDLLAVRFLVLEDVVALRGFGQRQAVRDDPCGLEFAALGPVEQRSHVALDVALAGAQRQRPVH